MHSYVHSYVFVYFTVKDTTRTGVPLFFITFSLGVHLLSLGLPLLVLRFPFNVLQVSLYFFLGFL